MIPYVKRLAIAAVLVASALCLAGERPAKPPGGPIYVVTNDDYGVMFSTISIYQATTTEQGPSLVFQNAINISGRGGVGGFFGTPRITMLPDPSTQCLYASNAATNDIAAVNLQTQQLAGIFAGRKDTGSSNGIGLVMNGNYLYAGFTLTNTIAVFAVQAGCQLSFVDHISVAGLNGGSIGGMALRGNLLVVAYGDGSIESFNVANGVPVPNNDEQNSTGFASAYFPESVDITQDGHFAIFGDAAVPATVEVSDISGGKLAPTVQYTPGTATHAVTQGVNSSTVRLSPDETLLYIGDSQSGHVTAAFFNKTSGKITPGCVSARLNNFYNPWSYVGGLATRDTTGAGGVLYVAEFGSSIAIVNVASDGTTCSLTESAASPVGDERSPDLLSIQVVPPRPF